jgi:hypothetical protein
MVLNAKPWSYEAFNPLSDQFAVVVPQSHQVGVHAPHVCTVAVESDDFVNCIFGMFRVFGSTLNQLPANGSIKDLNPADRVLLLSITSVHSSVPEHAPCQPSNA